MAGEQDKVPSRAWRFIDDGAHPVHLGLAIDEVLLDVVDAPGYNGPNILRCYQFSPPSVVLGCNQDVKEVDMAYIASVPLQLGRRITGGGAIIMGVPDPGAQLGVSIIARHEPGYPVKPGARYALLAKVIVAGLRDLGLPVTYESNSDITLDGRKIAGQAAVLARDVTFLHSSITMAYDIEVMLRVARVKPDPATVARASSRYTTVTDHLPRATIDGVKAALVRGISTVFDATVSPGPLTAGELDRARELVAKKHGTPEHVYSDGGEMGSCFL